MRSVDIVITPAQVANLNVQQHGAPQPPPLGLTPGQTVEALVLQTLADGRARIAVANTVLDVETTVPLLPGAQVKLAVSETADGIKLTIVPSAPGGAPATGTAVTAPGAGAVADLAKSFATPTVTAPATPATPGAPAPAVALAEAVETAATRQGSLAPLMADVANLVDTHTLPPRVRDAAMQLLALRLPGGGDITAEDVQRAFTRSGTLMEARLGAAASGQASAGDPEVLAAFGRISDSPPDLKLALVVLRQVLKSWMDGGLTGGGLDAPEHNTSTLPPAGPSGTAAPHGHASAPVPPPYRGGPTQGQPPVGPSIGPGAPPEAIGAQLLAETDAAIARQTLMQAASLPDSHDAGMPRAQHADVRWNFEIPIVMPQGTTIAQFEIERDGQGRAPDDPQRVWRVRFALDVEPMGPVHGQISFNPSADGPRTSVMLWADRAESAAKLRANTQQLTEALRTAELAPGDVSVRAGNPPPTTDAPPAGHFLDRAS